MSKKGLKLLDLIRTPEDIKNFSNLELEELCSEIRHLIIETVNKTGGHLGSSLGAVELCVALHKVYNAPYDKIIFDIGHQAYAHKILTERKDKFSTLRTDNGISGFNDPMESIYDESIGGHSSVSLSFATGVKQALKLKNNNDNVVAVIGDASITSGVAFEALNHAGFLKDNMLFILNDNDLSISKPVGALSKYFEHIRSSFVYDNFRKVKNFAISKLPSTLKDIAINIENNLSIGSKNSTFFDDLGFQYIGVIDGHNIEDLVKTLEYIKELPVNRPILLHVITKKGKGFINSENASDGMHGVKGVSTVNVLPNASVFSNALIKLAEKDKSIVAISAAMTTGTGLNKFEKKFPDRVFDVGIAEQHAVTFAAGLAKQGLKPFVAIYSTFMQRAYDQVIHDVSISSLPVRFIMDRAGFVGVDGATHAGLYDYAMFLSVPNIVFCAPSNSNDIPKMLAIMLNINNQPSFMRYYKDSNGLDFDHDINLGKGVIIYEGSDIAVLSLGEILLEVLEAYENLVSIGKKVTVVDLKFALPIDKILIKRLCENHKCILVVEEGFGNHLFSIVYACIEEFGFLGKTICSTITIKNSYISHNINTSTQRYKAEISSKHIFNRLVELFDIL